MLASGLIPSALFCGATFAAFQAAAAGSLFSACLLLEKSVN
jgi:hypothetical protein